MDKNQIFELTNPSRISDFRGFPQEIINNTSYLYVCGDRSEELVFCGIDSALTSFFNDGKSGVNSYSIEYYSKFFKRIFGANDLFDINYWKVLSERARGRFPHSLYTLKEGTVITKENIVATIFNQDYHSANLNKMLMAIVQMTWYPSACATKVRKVKKVLKNHLTISGTLSEIGIKVYDCSAEKHRNFGEACNAGMSHLMYFLTTFNTSSISKIEELYDYKNPAHTIPVIDSDLIRVCKSLKESGYFQNLISKYLGFNFGIEIDDNNPYRQTSLIVDYLSNKFTSYDKTIYLIVDGDDLEKKCLRIMKVISEKFPTTDNVKNFKVLPGKMRIMYNGLKSAEELDQFLTNMEKEGWSSDNFYFQYDSDFWNNISKKDCQYQFRNCAVTVSKPALGKHEEHHPDDKFNTRPIIVKEGKDYKTCGTLESMTPDKVNSDLLLRCYHNGTVTQYNTFQEIRDRANCDI